MLLSLLYIYYYRYSIKMATIQTQSAVVAKGEDVEAGEHQKKQEHQQQGFIQDFLLGGGGTMSVPPPPPPGNKELHLRPILIQN